MKKINLTKIMSARASKEEKAEVLSKIQAEIDLVQKRSRERTIDAEDVSRCVNAIRDKVDFLSLSDLEGCVFSCDINAQNFPNAYKYRPESTHFTVEVIGKKFFLTYIERDTCRRAGHEVIHHFTKECEQAFLEKFKF